MSVKTTLIPVIPNITKPPTEHVSLIVDTQTIADKFKGAYLQRTGRNKSVLVFGGYIVNNVPTPVYADCGKAMTLMVGAPYKSRRNNNWDNSDLNCYDYRSAAFGPDATPDRPTLTNPETSKEKLENFEVAYLKNIINTYGDIEHISRTHTYNSGREVETITITYKVKRK